MASVPMSPELPDAVREPRLTDPREAPLNSVRLPELALFALLSLEAIQIRGYPLTEIAGLLLVCLAFFRAPSRRADHQVVKALSLLFLTVVVFSTFVFNDTDNFRRVGHLAVWAALIFVLASGRLSFLSSAYGLMLGVVAGALTGVFGIDPLNGYGDRLTGLFGEPNLGGLIIVAYGLIAFSVIKSKAVRVQFLALCAVALFMTESRTAWMAAAIAVVWINVASRVRPWASAVIMTASWPMFSFIVDLIQGLPMFDYREGSDQLREKILAAEDVLVAENQIVGHGAGTAIVNVGGLNFFFHNSYLALRAEFGWMGLVVLMAIVFTVSWRLVALPQVQRNRYLEGALIATAAVAVNLGEVLLALQCSVVLGMALAWVRMQRTSEGEVPLVASSEERPL